MQATSECTVEGCNALIGTHGARGMCRKHYERLRLQGRLELLPPASPADRLFAGLERKPNGCLEWTRAVDHAGYGWIHVDGATIKTHRLAWELANGPIPDDLIVRHFVCDNPPCCEPTHLRLGTHAANAADKVAKGRQHNNGHSSKTHCKWGHPFDEANTYAWRGERRCRACSAINQARHRLNRNTNQHT